jgi:peptidyl-prolyl cis-trans isomerase C
VNDVSESPAARAAREEAARTSPLLLIVPAVIAICVVAAIAFTFMKDDGTESVDGSDVEVADDSAADTTTGTPDGVELRDMPDVAARFGGVELSGADLLAIVTGATGVAPSPQALADQVTTWLLVEAVSEQLSQRGIEITDQDRVDSEASAIAAGVPTDTLAFDAAVNLQVVINALNGYAQATASTQDSTLELICSSHILLETEADAFNAIDRIEAGEDFAAVAMDLSTGPSGPSGGQLGCVDTTTFVAEYVDGARASGVGVTAPVESQFGFHVIEVRYLGPLVEDADASLTPEQFASLNEGATRTAEGAVFDEIVALASEAIAVEHFIDPSIGVWIFPPGAVQAPPTDG